jgi:DNA-binding NtrC family response regulator
MKILLVDDEKDITEIISEILTDKGHSVSTFDCPVKAIEDLKDNQYDVNSENVKVLNKPIDMNDLINAIEIAA